MDDDIRLLALEQLRRTPGSTLAKAAVKELVHQVLGLVERRRWPRTPAGEEALERQRTRSPDGVGAVVGTTGGSEHSPDTGGWRGGDP